MTRIIADIKDKADAEAIYRVIKRFKAEVKMLDEKEWEDYILGKMADEAEAEGGVVSRAEMSKWFKTYGIDF